MLVERLYHEREAELQARVDRRRVRVVYASGFDEQALASARADFASELGLLDAPTREDGIAIDTECEVPGKAAADDRSDVHAEAGGRGPDGDRPARDRPPVPGRVALLGRGRRELRVSWRIPAPSNRRCRPPTEAELRGVLPHMRRRRCARTKRCPFRLTILLDGDTLRAGPVGRSSARARTVSVHERFPIPPGRHALEVSFLPDPPTQSFDDSTTSPAANPDPSDSSGDPAMVLSTIVSADARDVILVTPDDGGRLAVVTPPTPN